MERLLRVAFPGALYHITSRGNRGDKIFLDISDREDFLRILFSIVIEGIGGQSPLDEVSGQILLGGKRFVERFKELSGKKDSIKEIPRVQRYAGRPPLGQLLDRERLGDKRQRDKLLFEAHIKYGYTLKEISDHLGVHYTTVSHVINLQEKASNK